MSTAGSNICDQNHDPIYQDIVQDINNPKDPVTTKSNDVESLSSSESDGEITDDNISLTEISDSETGDESFEKKVDKLLERLRLQSDIDSGWPVRAMDKAGPFHVDKELVPVDIYQKGLHLYVWDPIYVTSAICVKCRWTLPEFHAIDYFPSRGFLCCLVVNKFEFLASVRGRTPTSAAKMAAARFLQFLGFTMNVANVKVLCDWPHTKRSKKHTNNSIKIKERLKTFNLNKNIHISYRPNKLDPSLRGSGGSSYKVSESFKEMEHVYLLSQLQRKHNKRSYTPTSQSTHVDNESYEFAAKRSKVNAKLNVINSDSVKHSITDLRQMLGKNIKDEPLTK